MQKVQNDNHSSEVNQEVTGSVPTLSTANQMDVVLLVVLQLTMLFWMQFFFHRSFKALNQITL